MQASELIARSLRLINVPGRGASLAAEDQSNALTALQEILDSKAITKQFVPGIRRHFFAMQSGKAIYTYGAGSQVDLRADDFDDDPAPIRIESAYIRQGSAITNNEQVDEYRFENVGTWATTGTAAVGNNQATLDGIGTLSQPLALGMVPGTTYTLRFSVTVNAGDAVLQVQQNAVDILNLTIDSSGDYEFDFLYSTTLPTITFTTASTADDLVLTQCSIIERGKTRLELPDGQGTDSMVRIIDQTRYNAIGSKGQSGYSCDLLYSRGFPNGEIRFNSAPQTGEILVMDVLVNRVSVNSLQSTVRLNPEAIRWIRLALADHLAPEYGKELSLRQIKNMETAWDDLAAGTQRRNLLTIDPGLLHHGHGYNINRD